MFKKWIKEFLQISDISKMSVPELRELQRASSEIIEIKTKKVLQERVHSVLKLIEEIKYARGKLIYLRQDIKIYNVGLIQKEINSAGYKWPVDIPCKELLRDGVMKINDVVSVIQYLEIKENKK